MSRSSKMLQFVNWRMRVTISDTRTLLGTLMAFDRHMNIVLGDCEEYRKFRGKKASEDKEEKRMLGLVMLRGENVISLAAESPPLQKAKPKGAGRGGPGAGRAAGRGMPVAPLSTAPKGLTGPVRGVGGPAPAQMMPQSTMQAQPVTYGRGMPGRGGPVPGMPGMPGMPPGFPPQQGGGMPPRPPMGFAPPPQMGRGMPGPPQMGFPPGPPRPGGPPMFGGPQGGPPMMNRPPPPFGQQAPPRP